MELVWLTERLVVSHSDLTRSCSFQGRGVADGPTVALNIGVPPPLIVGVGVLVGDGTGMADVEAGVDPR